MTELYVTQRALRMLADRSLRIYRRRKVTSPALGLFEATLVPTLEAFRDAYDDTRNYEAERVAQVTGGRGAIRNLYKEIRTCLPVLERDVAGFDSTQLLGSPDDPDNVIGDAERLMELVSQHRHLPYAQAVLERIGATLPIAKQEWDQAQDAIVQRQAMLAKTRELALAAQQELVAFRKTLRYSAGSHDHDYRLLRLRRSPFIPDEPEATQEADAPHEPTTQSATSPQAPAPNNGHTSTPELP